MARGEQPSAIPEQPPLVIRGLQRRDMKEMLRVASESTGGFWIDEDLEKVIREYPVAIGVTPSPSGPLVGLALGNAPRRGPRDPFSDEDPEIILPALDSQGNLPIILFVAPEWREKGVGEKLRDHIWNGIWRIARGISVLVSADEEALEEQTFLRSLGFVVPVDAETNKPTVVTADGKEYYKMVYSG